MEVTEILQALSTAVVACSVFILNSFKGSLDKANVSIALLNTNIAKLIANDENKDKRLDMLDAEIHNNRSSIHTLRNETQKHISRLEIAIHKKE